MIDRDYVATMLVDLMNTHPDVAQGVGPNEAINWLTKSPWLAGLAGLYGLSLSNVVTAAICFSFEWGIQFEKQNGHPPTDDDWKAAYYNNANAFANKVGLGAPFKEVDGGWRLDQRLGGPF